MGANDHDTSGDRASSPSGDRVSAVYATYGHQVRRDLSSFGVGPSDVEDLSQEVFLVALAKGEAFAQIERLDLWLREVCRKVAAGHRRRGGRQREIPANEGLEAVEDSALTQSAVLEQQQDAERLHLAMAALDDEARDLIAMHELGGLPLVDVATLVDRDRKTVSKRLAAANRRLTRLFLGRESTQALTEPRRFAVPPAATAARVHTAPLQVLAQNADIVVGRVGALIIAVWPGRPTIEALELLEQHLTRTAELHGSGLVYLAIVEASTNTPTLEARKKITSMLRAHAQNFGVYPHVLLGGFSWIVRPIMAGLTLLSGVPGSMPFFGSVERACAWLSSGYLRGAADERAILAAARELRAIAARGLEANVS